MGTFSPAAMFAINAITFVISAGLVLTIHRPPKAPHTGRNPATTASLPGFGTYRRLRRSVNVTPGPLR